MTEQDKSSYFKKSTRTSTRFFRQIWHFDQTNIETVKIYRGYLTKGKCSYINDFVNNCTLLPKNLSTEEILSIHETNADRSDCNNTVSNETNGQHDHSDESNIKGNPSTSQRWQTSQDSYENDQWTALLTDSFLDKFHIPPGQKKTRLKTYEMKSELFFHCLSYLIGTRFLVKLRQKVWSKNMENFFSLASEKGCCYSFIGSKSEGFDFDGSDSDMLLAIGYAHETTSIDVNCKEWHFEYQSLEEGIYPGYVLLRFSGIGIINSSLFHKIFQQESGNSDFMMSCSSHGPAMMQSVYHNEYDYVTSITSLTWPEIAEGWKTRHRNFGWPSEEMIKNITSKGCHIVPVGSKRNHTVDTEWRLSFCIAERELIWTFNQTQILIYGLLKLVLKEYINPACLKKDLITSYFLKTVMFWMIEETHLSIWSPNNTMLLFHLTFKRLVQFIASDECPNYFVPSNNMLKDRIDEVDRAHLLQILFDIEDSGMAWMYHSESLRPFVRLIVVNGTCSRHHITSIRHQSNQKSKVDSHLLILSLVCQYRQLISGVHHQNKKIIKAIKSFTIKRNVLPILAHFIKADDKSLGNKTLASLKKFCMDLYVQEAFGRVPFGKNMLALHFYREGKFNDCLRVLNSMLGCMDFCITHNTAKTSNYDYLRRICIKCVSTLTHVKLLFTIDIALPFSSHLMSKELVILLGGETTRQAFKDLNMCLNMTIIYPETFVHFVRCLCLIKLKRNEGFDDAYRSLRNIKYVIRSNVHKAVCLFPLLYCQALIKGIIVDPKNIRRDIVSHLNELDIPVDFYLAQTRDIPRICRDAGFNSTLYEHLAAKYVPSDILQPLKEQISKVPPSLRPLMKLQLDSFLSTMPPEVRQAVNSVLSKL